LFSQQKTLEPFREGILFKGDKARVGRRQRRLLDSVSLMSQIAWHSIAQVDAKSKRAAP